MLNISMNTINQDVDRTAYAGLTRVENMQTSKVLRRLLYFFSIAFLILMFIPWTQFVRAKGQVTTLLPQQRPQMVNTTIGGRVEKWYVREGDYVNRGDTILNISEVKAEYFDPQLLRRTQDQINTKESTVGAYAAKANALANQMKALKNSRDIKILQANNKLEQSRFKVLSDSTDLEAKLINLQIAERQAERQQALYDQGLKSLTDLEKRSLTLQKAQAEKVSAENKLLTSRASVLNALAELDGIEAKFQDDLAKAQSDRFTAISNQYDAEISVTKLENQFANYDARNGFYFITAPQDGYVTRTITSGIGEMIKEGDQVVSIMPSDYELAVSIFVRPIDLPLMTLGQEVRIVFDGWPAIVFSGWPNTSYGTFGGEIFAIDNFISDNGMYRILVSQSKEEPWPDLLRVGGGANGLILLKDVPIWYELWRNLNGFPPDFYAATNASAASSKKGKK